MDTLSLCVALGLARSLAPAFAAAGRPLDEPRLHHLALDILDLARQGLETSRMAAALAGRGWDAGVMFDYAHWLDFEREAWFQRLNGDDEACGLEDDGDDDDGDGDEDGAYG